MQERHNGPLPTNLNTESIKQYNRIVLFQHDKAIITTSEPNNCILVDDNPSLVKNIITLKKKVYYVVQKFSKKEDFFTYPLPSSHIGICCVSGLQGILDLVPVPDVKVKCALLPYNGKMIAFPLRHYN